MPVYVVHDPGIIVDLSLQSVGMLPERPAWHAAELLDRLMHDAEFAGKWALEKALKKSVIWHDAGIRPFPWTVVLRHFNVIERFGMQQHTPAPARNENTRAHPKSKRLRRLTA